MSTTTPLPVTADDKPRWRRLAMDAADKGLWFVVDRFSETADTTYAYCTVESYTGRTDDARDSHDVDVLSDETGVHVRCDCEAAVLGQRPCTHAARVLDRLHLFPFPIFEQPALPLYDVPPAESHKCWTCGLVYGSAHQLAVHRSLTHGSRARPTVWPDPEFAAALFADARSVRERMAGAS